jgi:uncharacterized protein (TIGR03089 family)
MPPSTIPELMTGLLRGDTARPLLTFYDDATGERVELSVATFANWVAKTASLAQEELDVEPGDLVVVDLPTHWLGAVWLLAAWTAGYRISTDPASATRAGLVVCGPASLDRHGTLAATVPVAALSLRPLGGRFTTPLPLGMVDFGAVVLAQPDVFSPITPPDPDAAALESGGRTWTQRELLAEAAEDPLVGTGDRLLTGVNPCSAEGAITVTSVLLRSASMVLVANAEPGSWELREQQERATAQRRSAQAG